MPTPLIMVAPNGARRTAKDHPRLPVTLPEILATARECAEAGAQAMHLHVRDNEGGHSLDAGLYREALREIGAALPDLRLQITTEAAGLYDVPSQWACLRQVVPAWASISIREIARAPELAADIYAGCAAQGTEVQHILYGPEDIDLFHDWRADGTIAPEQDSVLLVLGRYTDDQQSDSAEVAPLRERLGEVSRWMVCAFGRREHDCLAAAARLGGDVRVGFENSLTGGDGRTHADNAASVRDLVERLKA